MKYVNIGRIVSGVSFTFLVNVIINPLNKVPMIEGKEELFFDE